MQYRNWSEKYDFGYFSDQFTNNYKLYKGDFIFHHFDTYRITTEEAIEAGFDEILSEKDSVKIIEWSENIAELLPDSRIVINITTIDETKREIEIIYE